MTSKRRIAAMAAMLAAIALLALIVVFGDQFKVLVSAKTADAESTASKKEIIYWANGNKDPNDNIPAKRNDFNFGWDRYQGAQDAIVAKKVKDTKEFIIGSDGKSGDFFYSLEKDPALTAAIALQLDLVEATPGDPILAPEMKAKKPIGERADAAHLRYLEHPDQWDEALARIKAILTGKDVTVEVRELADYTSAMYMVVDGLGDKPAVVVRNTEYAGGHFIIFHIKRKDGTTAELKLRLECGYQPIEPPTWNPPPEPPVPDNPPDNPPEEKDPADDPQNRKDAEKYPFYSPDRKNNNPDKTVTTEPVSPDEYEAPKPPVDDSSKADDGKKKQEDASAGTKSGSKTVDKDNGKTEKHDGKEYQVEAGDGKDHGDLAEKADPSNPEKQQIDPALKDDSVNDRAVTDFE